LGKATQATNQAQLQTTLIKDEGPTEQSPLFVPECPKSDDSEIEEIVCSQGLIQAKLLTDAPNSPVDSVLTDSSPSAKGENRKLQSKESPIRETQNTNRSSERNDGRQRWERDGTTLAGREETTAASDLQVILPSPVSLTNSSTKSLVSGKVSAKRSRSPSTTIERDRPVKLRCERDSLISSEQSLHNLQLGPSIANDRSSRSLEPRYLPAWYADLENAQRHLEGRWFDYEYDSSALLRALNDQVSDIASQPADNSKDLKDDMHDLREHLHELMARPYRTVTPRILYVQHMLHLNGEGLLRLIDGSSADAIDWPLDIRADAMELYQRWHKRQFDPDPFRGIILGKPSGASYNRDHRTDELDPDWLKRFPRKFDTGSDDQINGQWWPTQLAAIRDGAHANIDSWIARVPGTDVVSCILRGGFGYDNVDYGDEILLSTWGVRKNKSCSLKSQAMCSQSEKHGSIRLLRSSSVESKYAPKAGLRYDGLYYVAAIEMRPPASDPKQRYRFRLKRVSDQDPIRWKAPYARPTRQELEVYDKTLRDVA
jgi:hypothetical protein